MTQSSVAPRRPWRRRTKVSLLISIVIISGLIYWEQTALLYVLSTLAVCALLLLVGFADLKGKDREVSQPRLEQHQDFSATLPPQTAEVAGEIHGFRRDVPETRTSARSSFRVTTQQKRGSAL